MKDFYDGIIPEEGEEESLVGTGVGVRLRAFLLLLIFFLPIIFTVIEILTGFFSNTISPSVVPTPTLSGLGHF